MELFVTVTGEFTHDNESVGGISISASGLFPIVIPFAMSSIASQALEA